MKKNNKGFTIVELVIVIAVIAILAAVLIPTFSNVLDKAKESSAMQQAKAEWELYLAENVTSIDKNDKFIVVTTYEEKEYVFSVTGTTFNTEALNNDNPKNGYNTNSDESSNIEGNSGSVTIHKETVTQGS